MKIFVEELNDDIVVKIYKDGIELSIDDIPDKDRKTVEDILYKGYSIIKRFY